MLQSRMLLRRCCRFLQQCRSNVRFSCQKRQKCRTCFTSKFRSFDQVECCFDKVELCFDIVAKTATISKQHSTNLPVASTMLLWYCCRCGPSFMGQISGVHAFGCNSAKSEPLWMKSRALWTHCWGLALADFERDPRRRSSDSLRGKRNKNFGHVNNAQFHRFPVGQILRHLNTTTSIDVAMKIFGTEFRKFYRKGSFSKNAKISTPLTTRATLWNFVTVFV